MFFEYPSETDWNRIAKTFPVEQLNFSIKNFRDETKSFPEFLKNKELQTWAIHLKKRLGDVLQCYVFLIFYYEQGIPDTEWFISPGNEGQTVQYFPHFQEKHFLVKTQFDFFADTFYYKIFSAWDTVGHLLNTAFELKVRRPNFNSVVEKLSHKHPDLYNNLNSIIDNPDFKQTTEIRNDITHNYLPSHIDSGITRQPNNIIEFGVGKYTDSTTIHKNVIKSLELFTRTLEYVKKYIVTKDG